MEKNKEKRPLFDDLESVLLGVSSSTGDEKVDLGKLCNALSLLHVTLGDQSWVGLYLVHEGHLILGPFQGTPACEVIAFGKGVVGTCYARNEPIAIEDVTKIENYICCDAAAKSEICVPILKGSTPIGVLDIDLPVEHVFCDEEIKFYVAFAEKISKLLR